VAMHAMFIVTSGFWGISSKPPFATFYHEGRKGSSPISGSGMGSEIWT